MAACTSRLRSVVPLALAAAAFGLGAAPASAQGSVRQAAGDLAYTVYSPPAGLAKANAAEPSIGVDWQTGAAMYLALQQTLKITFDDSTVPATATWTDVSNAPLTKLSAPGTPATNATGLTLDPILYTDPALGRTFVSELSGVCSFMEYTDDDGATWTPSEGCGPPAGFDHQSVGSGPYSATGIPPQSTVYPHAVYYCSQADVDAHCSRSDDGGISFGPGVPVYTVAQCGGLHGHITGSPDGTVYLPNQNCATQPDPAAAANGIVTGITNAGTPAFANQAAIVSEDNGNTWSVRVLPTSHATLRSDPSTSTDKGGRTYFAYEDAVMDTNGVQVAGHALVSTTSDHGLHWSAPVDVGAAFGVRNVTFPEIIAGDAGRAAYAFLGSTTAGNAEDTAFHGIWDLYVGVTQDAGQSWTVTDVTPNAPVERDCIYLAGNGSCPSSKRNLLDFMTIAADEDGRPLVGYADGCIGACAAGDTCALPCNTGPAASTARFVQVARQACGPSLVAETDARLACAGAPPPSVAESPWAAAAIPLIGAAAMLGVRRRRQRTPEPA